MDFHSKLEFAPDTLLSDTGMQEWAVLTVSYAVAFIAGIFSAVIGIFVFRILAIVVIGAIILGVFYLLYDIIPSGIAGAA